MSRARVQAEHLRVCRLMFVLCSPLPQGGLWVAVLERHLDGVQWQLLRCMCGWVYRPGALLEGRTSPRDSTEWEVFADGGDVGLGNEQITVGKLGRGCLCAANGCQARARWGWCNYSRPKSEG